MKIWVETRLVEPPDHTVTGSFGSSVMFVAYFKWLNEWRWLQPNNIEEKIAEPEKLFLDENYVRSHTLKTPRGRREKPTHIRRKKHGEQLLFELHTAN
jgi:hypothetical protein